MNEGGSVKQGEAGKSLDRILRLETGLELGLASLGLAERISRTSYVAGALSITLHVKKDRINPRHGADTQDLMKKEPGEPAFKRCDLDPLQFRLLRTNTGQFRSSNLQEPR